MPPLPAAFLKSFDHRAKLRIIGALVVVSKALFRVASRAGDREILQIVGPAMVFWDDVLERGPVERRPVCAESKLSLTVNAFALEDLFTVELLALERPVGHGDRQKQALFATRQSSVGHPKGSTPR